MRWWFGGKFRYAVLQLGLWEKDERRKDAVQLFARQTFYPGKITNIAITRITGQKLADIQAIVKIPLRPEFCRKKGHILAEMAF